MISFTAVPTLYATFPPFLSAYFFGGMFNNLNKETALIIYFYNINYFFKFFKFCKNLNKKITKIF